MKTKEEAIAFGLSFPDSYIDNPFRTADWELIRFRENKKAFLLIYERNGFVNLNVKVHPEWRDFGEEFTLRCNLRIIRIKSIGTL